MLLRLPERVGMGRRGSAAEREGLLEERLGLAVAALALVESRHVVEAGERVGMGVAEGLAAELEGRP